MNMQAIRQCVMELYPNQTWHRKVHHMPDNQVFAIWKRSQEKSSKKEEREDWSFAAPHQIDIWEWMNERSKVTNE